MVTNLKSRYSNKLKTQIDIKIQKKLNGNKTLPFKFCKNLKLKIMTKLEYQILSILNFKTNKKVFW